MTARPRQVLRASSSRCPAASTRRSPRRSSRRAASRRLACRCSCTTSARARRATGFGSCCTLDDLADARRVAAAIGIPHYIMNFERQFEEQVIANFVREYAGRAHAPALRALQQRPEVRDAARARARPRRRPRRHRPLRARRTRRDDRALSPPARPRCVEGSVVFPVLARPGAAVARPLPGRRAHEGRGARARAPARLAGRGEARQPGDLLRARWRLRQLRRAARAGGRRAAAPSPTATGRVLGRHEGIHRFTVGQRKGLRLSASEPLYVLALDPADQHRRRGPARGARRDATHGVGRELDRRRCAGRPARAPPCRFAIATRPRARRVHAAPWRAGARRVRRAPARRHAGPGGRVLRG